MAATVARAVVFIAGLFFGLLLSATAGYFGGGGGPAVVRLARVFSPLAMGLAAASAWVLTAKSGAGDRWTIGHLVAWLVFLVVSSLLRLGLLTGSGPGEPSGVATNNTRRGGAGETAKR